VVSNWCQGCQVLYLLVAFFLGFVVDLDPLATDLATFLALFKATLDPFVLAVDLAPFVAVELAPSPFVALDPFVALLVCIFCRSLASNSSTEEQPVAFKIRWMAGESLLI